MPSWQRRSHGTQPHQSVQLQVFPRCNLTDYNTGSYNNYHTLGPDLTKVRAAAFQPGGGPEKTGRALVLGLPHCLIQKFQKFLEFQARSSFDDHGWVLMTWSVIVSSIIKGSVTMATTNSTI